MVPTYPLPPWYPTLATTWHGRTPGPTSAPLVASQMHHQAHVFKMEILSVRPGPVTVLIVHVRPAPDVLPAFQTRENIRLLIERNTKGISLRESKGIISAQKRKTGKKTAKTANCTETCTRQTPVPQQDQLAKLDTQIW